MKFTITMKDPDGVYEAVRDAAYDSILKSTPCGDDLDALAEIRQNTIKSILGKWFKYDEYLSVEVDTDAKTIKVVEVS